MQKTFEIIPIKWTDCNQDDTETNCLYCAYGDSPIYGQNVLLYIGRTTQELVERNKQHLRTDFARINNIRLKKGVFEDSQTANEIIETAESLLITMLKPSYNSSNIKNSLFKEKLYLILNKGNRGVLPLEVSNIWWDN